jgi:tripartite-type tricarboxylate transporter receptor subunit TctC
MRSLFQTSARMTLCTTVLLVAAAAAATWPLGAWAQGAAYPNRSMTFVVAYTPGSANDILVRIVAPELGNQLGQPIVVDNKPGAGGSIGTALVAKSRPDGYTIGLGSTATMAINRALYKNLAYDPLKDFVSVIKLASTPNVLVVPSSSSAGNVQDLRRLMSGKKLHFSSPGNGTTQHLAGVLFNKLIGQPAEHVPFKGPAEAVTALSAGQLDFGFVSLPSALGQIQQGRLRALGVTPLAPTAALPSVPSLSSAGLAGFERTDVWFGIVLPTGTPEPIVQSIHRAASITLENADVRSKLAAAGYQPAAPASAADFQQFVREQVSFWADLVKTSGATVD